MDALIHEILPSEILSIISETLLHFCLYTNYIIVARRQIWTTTTFQCIRDESICEVNKTFIVDADT